MNPDVLLMDEPFSALDVLTAENLKSDLLELWLEKKTNTSGIILVTHNIEEAAMLADRIIIFGSNPGYIRQSVIYRGRLFLFFIHAPTLVPKISVPERISVAWRVVARFNIEKSSFDLSLNRSIWVKS
jgi:energy-coupling factor transporter ATP-binding protein EcfA2